MKEYSDNLFQKGTCARIWVAEVQIYSAKQGKLYIALHMLH